MCQARCLSMARNLQDGRSANRGLHLRGVYLQRTAFIWTGKRRNAQMKLPRLVVLLVVAALVGLLAPSGTSVSAQDATPVGTPAPPPGCEVIATGLLNPRQLDVASDGTIYVTEAGVGGEEEVTGIEEIEEEQGAAPSPVASPVGEVPPPATRGMTGQVT